METKGKHPRTLLNATVNGKVLHCIGHDDLDGKAISFPFKAIEWNTRDIEPGGIYISYLNYGYTIVEHDSMEIKI